MNQKVSVILPVFNGGDYLAQSIESVLRQTYTNLELVIVDDCSTDNTGEVIEAYAKQDARIKPVRNQNNLKLPASLNVGFSLASGTYYTWTSHDNLYEETAIATMVQALEEHPEAVLVCGDLTIIDGQGEVVKQQPLKEPEDIYLTNTVGACFLYRAVAAKRAGQYDTNLFLAEDYDYWIRLRKEGSFLHIPAFLYRYREHSGNLSATRKKENNTAYVKVVQKHFPFLYDGLQAKTKQDALINELMNRAEQAGMTGSAFCTVVRRRPVFLLRVLHGRMAALLHTKRG